MYVYELYTCLGPVEGFRCLELELWTVASHHVGAGSLQGQSVLLITERLSSCKINQPFPLQAALPWRLSQQCRPSLRHIASIICYNVT